MKKRLLIFCLLLLNICVLDAQNSPDSSYADAVIIYKNTIGLNQHIYNGSEYIDYDHRIKGTPFFKEKSFDENSIVYDGVAYNNVPLFYDILHDEIVIKNYTGLPLLLVKEKVSVFNAAGHHFINITTDSLRTGFKISGFYDVLHDGDTKFFAKRRKEIEEKIVLQETESSFKEKNEYFVLNKDILYSVNDKRSLLAAMKDQKNALLKYIQQDKIKFKKNFEAAAITTIAYYDGLNKAK